MPSKCSERLHVLVNEDQPVIDRRAQTFSTPAERTRALTANSLAQTDRCSGLRGGYGARLALVVL
jgi:hypothetical protein